MGVVGQTYLLTARQPKINSDSTSSKVTLLACANVQPEATATFTQLKFLDGLLNQLYHFPP